MKKQTNVAKTSSVHGRLMICRLLSVGTLASVLSVEAAEEDERRRSIGVQSSSCEYFEHINIVDCRCPGLAPDVLSHNYKTIQILPATAATPTVTPRLDVQCPVPPQRRRRSLLRDNLRRISSQSYDSPSPCWQVGTDGFAFGIYRNARLGAVLTLRLPKETASG
jgi:hypothetical protein